MNCNSSKPIDIQGHRGCRGLQPENTIPAFLKAIDLGVNTLELDVVITKDNVVLVSHEPYMNSDICLDAFGNEISKKDEKKHNIYQMTFDSIKKYDCGSKWYPRFPEQQKLKTYKPSLDEVIKESKKQNPNIKFNIEVKYEPSYKGVYAPKPKQFVALVLDVIEENNSLEHTNLQSFDLSVLEEIKRQSPKMKVALLVDENEDIWNKITKMSYIPEIISPYYKLLDEKTVRNLKAKGYQVIPWTVNTNADLKQMIALQVDGIITDYPDRLIEILKINQ
ncbi:MAG: glycerophosphodiester phosphodiesterase family protein [Flavobacteriaceae bacterium]|tara:strand:- start:412 stop:1245 length:834 start_codon:yes stop_codon:yes gene_type:complete